MDPWFEAYQSRIDIPPDQSPCWVDRTFSIPLDALRLRVRCEIACDGSGDSSIIAAFDRYIAHPDVTPEQADLIREPFSRAYLDSALAGTGLFFFDGAGAFRGRWDASFDGWKLIESDYASEGFRPGPIEPGVWRVSASFPRSHHAIAALIRVEASSTLAPREPSIHLYAIDETFPEEEDPSQWRIGELAADTGRSRGALSVIETLSAFSCLGYGFAALADADQPPLASFTVDPGLSVIRAQRLRTFDGDAIALGAREWISWRDENSVKTLAHLARETHLNEGLFCVSQPFSPRQCGEFSPWIARLEEWAMVDLLEIWLGVWDQRFPEIMNAFDLWDELLSLGLRIYGTCGKGPSGPPDEESASAWPKTVVYAQGASETALLSALKEGRFYSTVEPAVALWTESESGGAMMGDEMRLPVGAPYWLRLTVSQMQRGGYLVIKTDQGIFCQTPYSTRHETSLKFIMTAESEPHWIRVEIYQYGRPLDRLLAFTNPIFVRGMLSV
ncbi:MAG: hypothetical protein GC154_16550 [bacterium]|nr:hypothetical protein [bacterium]